ncbi:MAG TPA: MFS transporter [Pyrinomonadaceae bacterium]|jgi:MFS family permease|nr:MFS transporter [Pyrinomonadaceae bacterium]
MKYRHRVLGFLCLLAAITYLDRIAISVAGPRIQDSLHIGPKGWGWVVGVFTISYGIFEIPTGRMGDRIGARKVLTRVVLWWSAFTALTGLTSNYYVLLLIRFCFGAGEAGAIPNIGVVLSRWFPVIERARAMGGILMSLQAGGALAPLVIVPLQVRYGWRASFFVLGVIGIIWSIAWYRWYRDTPAEKEGVTQSEIQEIGTASFANNHQMPWGLALRSANLRAILLAGFCYVYGIYFFISWLHTFLVKGRGFSEADLLLSIAPGLLGACGNLAGGFVSDSLVRRFGLKWGRRGVGLIGLSVASVCIVATILTTNKFATLFFLGLVYAGITLQQTVVITVALDIGKKYVGGIVGMFNTICTLGGFLLSVSFGYFVTWFGSYDLALIPIACTLAIAAIAWLRIDATEELIPEGHGESVPETALPVLG